jgi:hypothetical protein
LGDACPGRGVLIYKQGPSGPLERTAKWRLTIVSKHGGRGERHGERRIVFVPAVAAAQAVAAEVTTTTATTVTTETEETGH